MFTRSLILFAVLIASFTAVLADGVKMKNGDRLTGSIVKADEKVLVIKTEYAGLVTIDWKAVDEVESSQDLNLFSKSGQRLVGKLTTNAGNFEVATRDAGKVSIARVDVVTVRNSDEQAAWQKDYDRYANPSVLDLWSGSADLGLSLTSGNSATTTLNAGVDLARVTKRDKTTVFYRQIQASDRAKTPTLRIANAKHAGVQYDLKVSDRAFVFGFTNFDFDEFLRLDLRFVGGGGFGYSIIKNAKSTLDLSGGIAYNKEIFDTTPAPTTTVPNPVYTTTSRDSIEGFVAEEWRYKISPRSSFFEKATLFPNFTKAGEFRFNLDAGVATALTKYLSWNLAFSNRYLSNPPLAGLKKNDTLLTTGIRFTFAK